MTNRSLGFLFSSAIAFTLVACGGIDHTKVEDSIKKTMSEKNITMKTVTCPPDEQLKAGAKFDCTGTTDDGTAATFHVDEVDSSGSVKWKLDGTILDQKKLGDDLESKLGAGSDVKCPTKTILLLKGTKITCDVTIGGEAKKLDITATDNEGNVETKVE